MRTIICRKCGKPANVQNNQRLCDECRAISRKTGIFGPRECCVCGTVFISTPSARYCPVCREERQRVIHRRSQERQRHGMARAIGSIDICQACGRKYTVHSGSQKYCPQCSEPQRILKQRARSQRYNRAHGYLPELREVDKICPICGQPFRVGAHRDTCSDRCAEIRRIFLYAQGIARRNGTTPPILEETIRRYDSANATPKGVSRSKNGKRYIAYATGHYIGTYDSVEEALNARREFLTKKPK